MLSPPTHNCRLSLPNHTHVQEVQSREPDAGQILHAFDEVGTHIQIDDVAEVDVFDLLEDVGLVIPTYRQGYLAIFRLCILHFVMRWQVVCSRLHRHLWLPVLRYLY